MRCDDQCRTRQSAGGTTAFKMGSVARSIIAKAKRRDKWVHMGRVNSRRRIQYASDVGCDSVDGSGFVRFLRDLPWGGHARLTMPIGNNRSNFERSTRFGFCDAKRTFGSHVYAACGSMNDFDWVEQAWQLEGAKRR